MTRFAIGLMSGTSCDGVSIALAAFASSVHNDMKVLAYKTYSYPSALRKKLLGGINLAAPEISKLNFELGNFFAGKTLLFLKQTHIAASRIAVIGSHGHTIYHGPDDHPRNTFQIGEASAIAEKTGIPVVADFRPRDIAAGGEGAPLIPCFDQHFFGQKKIRAMQNIGGIANVTVVGVRHVIAFDNGPGNCLIDWAIQKITKGKKHFDAGGKIARSGNILLKFVTEMSRHPYFKKRSPKSTGKELFNERFIPHALLKEKPEDIVATLTYFTAYSIWDSYQKFIFPSPPSPLRGEGRVRGITISEIVVSGGGALNKTLMTHLIQLFSPPHPTLSLRERVRVRAIEEFGIPAQAKEPVAFAFFALRAIEGKMNHLPQTTGAHKACVLGKMIPGKYATH